MKSGYIAFDEQGNLVLINFAEEKGRDVVIPKEQVWGIYHFIKDHFKEIGLV